ncbi:hypothetical protein C2E31_06255 [Rhodopirellula baltica]|nr:hypothetical protein C2E31_06255 [Rhodopirellula baltica]
MQTREVSLELAWPRQLHNSSPPNIGEVRTLKRLADSFVVVAVRSCSPVADVGGNGLKELVMDRAFGHQVFFALIESQPGGLG